MDHEKYMNLAVDEARAGMRSGDGGPFGAVIVRDGEIIGYGHNTVLSSHDPTSHAEVNAIRNACRHLGTHILEGAVIYSNFEPCPMCLAAIYWAGIKELRFASDRGDAEGAGFMDRELYEEVCSDIENRKLHSLKQANMRQKGLIEEWSGMENKQLY